MDAKNFNRKKFNEIHPEFRARLERYKELLDTISMEYRTKIPQDSKGKLKDISMKSGDLFEWRDREKVAIRARELNKRLNTITMLMGDIEQLMELRYAEQIKKYSEK